MRVSSRSEHALHAMLYIAAMKDRICTIDEISENENIPREYLAKVLRELVKKGLLKSFKGIFGGYRLAKAPGKISFLNIIEAMDGPLTLISCVNHNHAKAGKQKRKYCSGQFFWVPLQYKLKDALHEMTLEKGM
jgi:Rrf2 family protein